MIANHLGRGGRVVGGDRVRGGPVTRRRGGQVEDEVGRVLVLVQPRGQRRRRRTVLRGAGALDICEEEEEG